ncbi:MAG: SusC/RagA family TonB-linked outer membrane protein [Bacteroidaceae bacterium]|nr:SusC/RagA family TonB-linked outer membrane protein [Bacteroidaceae bacterium]
MKTLYKYIVVAIALLSSGIANAQITRVSGTISDEFGEIPGVMIKEVDGTNRTVNATTTDGNGNFTMNLKDGKKNKLVISCVGMKTQTIAPITKAVYKLTMAADVKTMKQVDVVGKKMTTTTGLSIPEREVSYAAQTLDAKEFEGLAITSIDEALQGRIAGLDIVANSGDLGAGTQMRLRGASTVSTLTTNEPLIVVNGNINSDVDLTDFDIATATEEKFAELLKVNTDDILRIEVLKDMSAAAKWGTRAANGVIEITTKRGTRGPARISYTGKLTATYQPEGLKMLNGDQYTMMLKEAFFNPKLDPTAADIPELNYDYEGFSEAYMYDNNTDWPSLIKQVGLRQNHYLSVTGGDSKTLFRIGAGYDHETGTVIRQKLNRFSTRMALDYFVSDRIKIISDFSLTYTDNDRSSGLVGQCYRMMPNLSPYYEYENGVPSNDFYFMRQDAGRGTTKLNDQKNLVNPVAYAYLHKFRQRSVDLQPRLAIEYKLLGLDDSKHQLRYYGEVFINASNGYSDEDTPRELSTALFLDTHSASSSASKSLSFTTKHELHYAPKFKNSDNFMTMMGRFELNSGSSNSLGTNANRLPSGVTSPSAGGLITGMSSGYGQWKGMNMVYIGHYSFKQRYVIGGTVRFDGTTKFGPSKRWSGSYALNAKWILIDEPWMQAVREKAKITMLAIRPAWGYAGNAPSSDYLYMNKYATGMTYLDQVSMNASGLKLVNMGPEHISSYNLGVDYGMWDGRLNMALELYSRTTTDMLMGGAGIPSSNGYSSLAVKNIGSMRNYGWEFNINTNNLIKKGKFGMDVYVNFANNGNVITSMDPTILEGLNSDPDIMGNAQTLQRVQIDNPFGSIYGFRWKGVYQYNYNTAVRMAKTEEGRAQLQQNIDNGMTYPIALNADGQVIYNEKGEPLQMQYYYKEGASESKFNGGDVIYEDVNHDGQINNLDIMYLGNSLPKLTGGFGITLRYGHWRLSSQFNYRVNIDVFNASRLDMERMDNTYNQSQAVNYRWRKEGDLTTIPRALNGSEGRSFNALLSDRYIEDASFLRLNYLQLSYTFDSKLVKKWHMNALRLNASANNLFCLTKFTGLDPEVGYGGYGVATSSGQTPRSKQWTFSATIEF